jgi:hypothetical protein
MKRVHLTESDQLKKLRSEHAALSGTMARVHCQLRLPGVNFHERWEAIEAWCAELERKNLEQKETKNHQ